MISDFGVFFFLESCSKGTGLWIGEEFFARVNLLSSTLEDQLAGCMDLGNQGGTGDCFFGSLVLCLETGRKRIEGTSVCCQD